MSSRKSKLHLIGAFAALATLALGVSCTGFFQNPTLTTITIDPPTPSVGQGATQQLTATGTFQDGTTAALTGGTSCSGNTVCWSSSDTTIATISTGGNVTGIAAGTATITAASGAITGTTTATVVLNNITNFQICEGTFGATSSCSSGSTPLTWNATLNEAQPFIAQGSSNGQLVDLTASSTWTVPSTATDVTCINSGTSPETCEVTTGATNTSVVVTYGTTTTTLSATLNVVVQ
jgi:hypothetical protein